MLNPSRHIFREWTPLPFSVHEDVGLEVGKEIIRKIAGALGHPMPAAPSSKDSREMMMDKLWRTHGLDEVEKGECGPQLKKCLHDVIKDLGHLNEADAKEQITINSNDQNDAPGPSPPLLYPGQKTDKTHNSRTPWLVLPVMTSAMNGMNKQTHS
jgi:hypothetical protein